MSERLLPSPYVGDSIGNMSKKNVAGYTQSDINLVTRKLDNKRTGANAHAVNKAISWLNWCANELRGAKEVTSENAHIVGRLSLLMIDSKDAIETGDFATLSQNMRHLQ